MLITILITQLQDIFRAKWRSIQVQTFIVNGDCVNRFEVVGPDMNGYITLRAVSRGGISGDILMTKWKGVKFQSFIPSPGECIKSFSISGPDMNGYIYLIANSNANSGQIITAKWRGIYLQDFNAGSCSIKGFIASGPDINGYVYLKPDTTCLITPVSDSENNKPHQETKIYSFQIKINSKSLLYSMPKSGYVKIKIYNISGRLVFVKNDYFDEPGQKEVKINLTRGAYIIIYDGVYIDGNKDRKKLKFINF